MQCTFVSIAVVQLSTHIASLQVRECATSLLQMARSLQTSIFLVGHVTKDGSIAGPKNLEHLVDAVLYLEGEQQLSYRLLRAVKNR